MTGGPRRDLGGSYGDGVPELERRRETGSIVCTDEFTVEGLHRKGLVWVQTFSPSDGDGVVKGDGSYPEQW